MAGKCIGSLSVDNGEDVEDDSASSPISYIEFLEQMCPYYMLFGMTYDQYWHQDVRMAKFYHQMYLKRQEVEAARDNQNAWIAGMYVSRALRESTEYTVKSMAKMLGGSKNVKIKNKYPDKPFDFDKKSSKKAELTPEEEAAAWRRALYG